MSEFKVGDVVIWKGAELKVLEARYKWRLLRPSEWLYKVCLANPTSSAVPYLETGLKGATKKQPDKSPAKTYEPLVWTKKVGSWHRRFVCKHCGFTKLDAVNTGFICPTCGCEDSLEKQVVRDEWEEARCEDESHPEYNQEQCRLYNSKSTGMFWVPILMRNYKLVTWDHCTAGEDK